MHFKSSIRSDRCSIPKQHGLANIKSTVAGFVVFYGQRSIFLRNRQQKVNAVNDFCLHSVDHSEPADYQT
ncbi:hypothetical protein DPMN_183808 [Dreissena polymorpha]|uniref:Uncharacterized protein n=1 Tax=Dreissena polymorpha TaxID=45954 RepID=A0A9D4DGN6_DREPO|nr:hypothetical protein DPMN_183808 [Dreissena polymorpha]